jgi:hypothetical protein
VTWQQADIRDWQPDERPLHDLVTASFSRFPQPVRRSVFAALAARVAPDGHLVIVGHLPSDLDTAIPRPPEPGLYYTADDLPAREWTVLTRAARPRAATTPDSTPVTIHDTVLTAQHPR